MIDEDKLNALELFGENEYLHKEIERLNKQLRLISDEFLKYDWEKELEKRFIEKINKELTINGYDEIEYWLASVEALDNNAVNDILEENKRLNNIINELENYIKESCWKDDWGVETIYVKMLLNKLQELKGSDKD